ncbi:unnamed protein product, partial [Brenthis ino]
MGLNAKEVVRVYACSTELSYNLSKAMSGQIYHPLNRALLNFKKEVRQIKETMRSIAEVISPVAYEIESTTSLQQMKAENHLTDALLDIVRNDEDTKMISNKTERKAYEIKYNKKMEIRCENQISHGVSICLNDFSSAYGACKAVMPYAMICWPLTLPRICDLKRLLGTDICKSRVQMQSNLSEGFKFLKIVKRKLTTNLEEIDLQRNETYEKQFDIVQDAKETGQRVLQAFEEKYLIMKSVKIFLNICLALLFLRIAVAAIKYHDLYLTSIDYDNVYITGHFKKLDLKRRRKNEFTLLPLKKMERNRYVDVHSATYIPSERSKLLTQILKVMLEAITATTFVMLDRLFYEALDVVRQYALEPISQLEDQDIEIKVEGKGQLSNMMRKILTELALNKSNITISNETCLPCPRAMPTSYYFKIYGGYLWILILLYINPYTLKLRRLICSYFYRIREKQRILHLYNDILKKRVKMDKTLRRKAVQAVRAHYLSGENLLSLRMRYPQMDWLGTLSAARMKCLICEETEPRHIKHKQRFTSVEIWHSCISTRCPFVYCNECWQEIGNQCLACDPALAELSDIDSLSDDNPPRY